MAQRLAPSNREGLDSASGWSLPVCCWHILSGYSGFIPQSKNMYVLPNSTAILVYTLVTLTLSLFCLPLMSIQLQPLLASSPKLLPLDSTAVLQQLHQLLVDLITRFCSSHLRRFTTSLHSTSLSCCHLHSQVFFLFQSPSFPFEYHIEPSTVKQLRKCMDG